jgi:putative MATE family efflux protein
MFIGTIANIILDPIFIFVLDMGVRGAALATVLAHILSIIFVIILFIAGVPLVKVRWDIRSVSGEAMLEILRIGMPQALAQIIMSFSFVFFNKIVMDVDPFAMTAFTLCGRFEYAALMPCFAIGSAIITIVGQNAGRGNFDRAERAWYDSMLFAVMMVVGIASVLFILAPRLYRIFSDVDTVISYAVLQTRILVFTYIFAISGILGRSVFQALGHPWPAIIITVLRLIGLALPAMLLFVYVLDLHVYGVWYGMIFGNGTSAVISFFWCRSAYKRLKEGRLKVMTAGG